ncbi:MAG: HlyD family type I secretion periplasmic adaptor subunit [Proteobacteria bacterium]|nr:MAG: HlyD family type I secretion periplasmic adaptor subunit [Pseudomonadota bacterium]
MDPQQSKDSWPIEARIPDLRRTIIIGGVVIGLAFAVFTAWGALAPLSGAVIANGIVKVDNNRKTVQHLEGGIVKEIRVRDGDRVKAGQVLVVLEDAAVDASLDMFTGQLWGEMAKAARLAAERDARPTIQFPSTLIARKGNQKVGEVLRAEEHLFEVRRQALTDQERSLRGQVDETKREVAGVTEQIESEARAIEFLKEELAANEGLYNDKFISKARLLALRRELAQTEAQRSEHVADVAKAKEKISELELRILNLRTQAMQQAADDLEQTTRRIYDLQERIRPSRDAMERHQVVAPVAGEVVNLRLHTVGGVLAPRDPILEIVPTDTSLIIEARVGVDDIDEVRPGVSADVRLTAYSQRSTPLVSGEVLYVSADRMNDENTHAPYYAAHVRVDAASLAAAGNVQLYPGMPAEVFIRTRERSALQYLLEPLTNTLRRAARET